MSTIQMTREEALELLGLKEGFTPEEMRSAERSGAKRWHPDHNKSETAGDEWNRFQAAKDRLADNYKTPEELAFENDVKMVIQNKTRTALNQIADILSKSLKLDPVLRRMTQGQYADRHSMIVAAIVRDIGQDLHNMDRNLDNARISLSVATDLLDKANKEEPEGLVKDIVTETLRIDIATIERDIKETHHAKKVLIHVRDLYQNHMNGCRVPTNSANNQPMSNPYIQITNNSFGQQR